MYIYIHGVGYILGCWGWGGGLLCLCPLGWGTQPRGLYKLGLTMKSIKTMKNINHRSICFTHILHTYIDMTFKFLKR